MKHIILIIFIIILFLIINKRRKKINTIFENFNSNNNKLPTIIWRQIYNHSNDIETNIDKFIEGNKNIIFINDNNYNKLFNNINKINKPYKIISDFIDYCVPLDKRNQNINNDTFLKVYNNPNLLEWWSINLLDKNLNNNNKFRFLPLGINFHTLNNMDIWGEKKTPYHIQEQQLSNIYKNSNNLDNRINKCFLCSSNNTSESLKSYNYINLDRDDINNFLKNNKNVETCNGNVPRNKLWEIFSKYRFIISPAGNGFDTHRMWEALFLGCIVIVQSTGLDKYMKNFPVIIVKDFSEINENNLKKWYHKYKNMVIDVNVRNKYYSKYWLDRILKF